MHDDTMQIAADATRRIRRSRFSALELFAFGVGLGCFLFNFAAWLFLALLEIQS